MAVYARHALLSDGWSADVRLCIDGRNVRQVETGVEPADGDARCDIVLPGLVNAHSHAFQRALVGRTERRAAATRDSFWTWREQMYALAAELDAPRLRAIAAQLYAEMLAAGYTTVVEFHYLLGGRGESDRAGPMLDALAAAADEAGIRLVYVPVLYEQRDFNDGRLEERQRRFHLPVDELIAHFRRSRELLADRHVVGLGAHSLRAVSKNALQKIADEAERCSVPFHLHIAEQQLEVQACTDAYDDRPVRWLLANAEVDRRWTLVHATHLDDHEVESLAASGAVVCLCPSTEGNLGDGFFRLAEFLAAGGTIAIGSDSHVTVDPFEELRWLEYGQRLTHLRRNVIAGPGEHSGRRLLNLVVAGGARAAGDPHSGLRPGARADLIALDGGHPALAGQQGDGLLDALVFSGHTRPIDRVMCGGEWRVANGRHEQFADIAGRYRSTLTALYPNSRGPG